MRLLREVGRSVSWSSWNPALLCLATKAALLRRAGKGSALRELSHSVLEELFEDEICVPERYEGYALARESSQSEVERLQGPGISWSEGLDPPPPDATRQAIAESTVGYCCADLKGLCAEVAFEPQHSIRRLVFR